MWILMAYFNCSVPYLKYANTFYIPTKLTKFSKAICWALYKYTVILWTQIERTKQILNSLQNSSTAHILY